MNVKQIRTALKLTQAQLAARLGVDQAAVCMWERGHRNPSGPVRKLLEIEQKKTLRKSRGRY